MFSYLEQISLSKLEEFGEQLNSLILTCSPTDEDSGLKLSNWSHTDGDPEFPDSALIHEYP